MAVRINPSAGRKSDKLWRDAIHLALKRPHEDDPEGRKKLVVAAEALVNAAIAGDVAAMREIGDRIDGKPAQAITGEDGGALIVKIMKFAGG